jgi:CRP/FNR family cyclic AMP-dependent transcriptional regulator
MQTSSSLHERLRVLADRTSDCEGRVLDWPVRVARTAHAAWAGSLPDFLGRWAWFHELAPDLRSLVVRTSVERTVAPGEYVARAGESSTHWYGLMQGFLQMHVVGAGGGETTLYCLREGEWGGEGSLMKKELRRYDLRALTPARLCLVPADTFETLRGASIEFNRFLCDVMNTRMGVFVGMLEASRLLGPDMRVARALLVLADNRDEDAPELSIPQYELALICGLSRQRVNLAISVFKRRGLVRSEPCKGSLLVHVPRLRAYVAANEECAGEPVGPSSKKSNRSSRDV